MIERYSTKEMKAIWSEDNKYRTWLRVELAVLKAYAEKEMIPEEDYLAIKEKARVDSGRIQELEALTRHDVIAFTRQISETLGPERKWVHYGLTSTDVVDSANACLLKEANEVIEAAFLDFLACLKEKALKYKDTPCIGRTHGIHAEVSSFGLKWLLFYDEGLRTLDYFQRAREVIEVGKMSGAVGNFANLDPEIEETACRELGIRNASVSSQVLSRDRHIQYFNALALIASLIEKVATEVRSLSRTEIGEVEEYFAATQKGSSAMPHKKNPVASENMCGLSRIVRAFAGAAYENNILWHERDISHSSAERIMFQEGTTLVHYMLKRYAGVIRNLKVNEERIKKNIYLTGKLVFSGRVVSALIEKGLSREESYDLVQGLAFKAASENIDFEKLLKESEVAGYLDDAEIAACFSLDHYLRNVDAIYKRFALGD